MKTRKLIVGSIWLLLATVPAGAQSLVNDGKFTLALPSHSGQLTWSTNGFTPVQTSAKPNGAEIGVRAVDGSKRFTILSFLFLVAEQAPMTSAKCRDGVMEPLTKSNPSIKIAVQSQLARPDAPPLEMVVYVGPGQDGKVMTSIRGFLAVGDLCGDLEIYGNDPSVVSDPNLKKIWESYHLDAQYVPQFNDVFLYAQILYSNHLYQAAAPMFEQALAKLKDDSDQPKMRRVTTDQAGMSYGLAGDVPKARALFNAAIAKDPDYPLYYYNLACADAAEKNLADARTHLQQAFARKANVIEGETMPDPTKDDSFLPYQNNKEFWTFVESLH